MAAIKRITGGLCQAARLHTPKICQRVFDIVSLEARIVSRSCQSDMIASHIIHAYKRGVRDTTELLIIARVAAVPDLDGLGVVEET